MNAHLRNRMIVSAPFGNYKFFDPRHGAIMTAGTFTWRKRAGWLKRMWKIVSTVRRYRKLGAWVNKLGLPSPGMPWLKRQILYDYRAYNHKIISIKGFTENEWENCIISLESVRSDREFARFAGVELNVSCPNVHDKTDAAMAHLEFAQRVLGKHTPIIVKLPPVGYMPLYEKARDVGITTFHCCNTLAVPGGGMSGKPLKPLSLEAIRQIRAAPGVADIVIIGGGGITTLSDAREYLDAGADSVAMASVLFTMDGRGHSRDIAAFMEGRREVEDTPRGRLQP